MSQLLIQDTKGRSQVFLLVRDDPCLSPIRPTDSSTPQKPSFLENLRKHSVILGGQGAQVTISSGHLYAVGREKAKNRG
jgi:hypothetical protein